MLSTTPCRMMKLTGEKETFSLPYCKKVPQIITAQWLINRRPTGKFDGVEPRHSTVFPHIALYWRLCN